MTIFTNLIALLKKKGFKDTITVLINQEGYQADKHTFYNELNKFSYYNSFFRVKDDLIKKGLIVIEQNNRVKHIKLTEKGLVLYKKLKEIDDFISN